jgi:Zn2+/Cd2+-exporting ATPase
MPDTVTDVCPDTGADCDSCSALAPELISLRSVGTTSEGALPPARAWWTQPRWQLLGISYSLLALGLLLDLALHQGFPSLIAFGGSIMAGAYPSARGAWKSLRRLRLSIATLVIVGAVGAVLLGLWDEAASLVAVYSLGGVLEARVVARARTALNDVQALAPATAILVRTGAEFEVPVGTVSLGDLIRVRPGALVPLDGTVVEGRSAVDQSSITGEPLPVEKVDGDAVFSGTMNQTGALLVRVTSKAEDSTVAQVIRAVEEARKNKSSLETFADRFGARYTPAMFALALGVALVPGLLGLGWTTWVYRALVLLVISCSCGLIMSVPVASLAAVTAGARRGLVIKGGAYLEAASRIDVVVLDKTGTLTVGKPQVRSVHGAGVHSPEDALTLAASVEAASEHPLAGALLDYAGRRGLKPPVATDFSASPGRGASAVVRGSRIWVGSVRWARESGIPLGDLDREGLPAEGRARLAVWDSQALIGTIEVGDALRDEARQAVRALTRVGIGRIVIMTGDARAAAESVGAQLGNVETRAELLPLEKAREVRELQREGHRVAFVGDGINDAPALAQADLGIAMGLHGTDIARASCDVVLMDDDLRRLPEVFTIGRAATKIMRQNVAVSLVEVAVLVALALTGVVGLVAGIALNEGSALAVMANGLRLNRNISLGSPGAPPGVERTIPGKLGLTES